MSKSNAIIVLDRGKNTACTIHLHGGTVLSWRIDNKELLYLKQKGAFNDISPIRGGINFAFPYVGGSAKGPKHGFARSVPWKLEEGPTTLPDGDVVVVLSLVPTGYTNSIWNCKFKFTCKVTLALRMLRYDLKVENVCPYFPFTFTILRHSQFRCVDVRNVDIFGLGNCKYKNLLDKTDKCLEWPSEEVKVNGECRMLFLEAPTEILVRNLRPGLDLKLTSDTKEFVVHNPWDETHKDVPEESQHYPDEYLHHVGVGCGVLSNPIKLNPLQAWESHQVVEVVDYRESGAVRVFDNLYDFIMDE
ncbi:uncharacterized protein LOC132702020 isoform X2 [Cylas formicarius]|uniref:uncharacterized protein LOC132702020 isoform X2 n=1 Tax=Cylas formicarius TaxID=197179 RepID=UPI0029589759|nr:uncharacterized protein LOC132702020 isoform X2 [Cylas formicarius]